MQQCLAERAGEPRVGAAAGLDAAPQAQGRGVGGGVGVGGWVLVAGMEPRLDFRHPEKNGLLGIFGPKIIITRLNAARCQLSDSLSTKVKLQEVAKLHAFEVDVSPCREFSIFRWIYFK